MRPLTIVLLLAGLTAVTSAQVRDVDLYDIVTYGAVEVEGIFVTNSDSIAMQNVLSPSGLWDFSIGPVEISIAGDTWTANEGPSTVTYNSPFPTIETSEKTVPATVFGGTFPSGLVQSYVVHDGDPDDALGDATFQRIMDIEIDQHAGGYFFTYQIAASGVSLPDKTVTFLPLAMGILLLLGGAMLKQRGLRT